MDADRVFAWSGPACSNPRLEQFALVRSPVRSIRGQYFFGTIFGGVDNPIGGIVAMAIVICTILVAAFFQYVVYRAYEYMIMAQLNLLTVKYERTP
ncbi:hypothetical protein Ddc_16648 [Ditylenchus destructor]|nr:hypothetical protein Ddc_16648 [Ditylenchus destructor]